MFAQVLFLTGNHGHHKDQIQISSILTDEASISHFSAKNTKNAFLALKLPFCGQSDNPCPLREFFQVCMLEILKIESVKINRVAWVEFNLLITMVSS